MNEINKKDKKIIKKKIKHGYAILELLFYISLFTILSLVVINAMITMTKAFKETAVQTELIQSATIMEIISREIRQAYNINTINNNNLVFDTKTDAGVNKTMEFSLSGENLELFENGVLVGNLNTPNIAIIDLVFTQIITTEGEAVKIFLAVKSNNDTLGRVKNFYDTIVLRGNY